MNDEDIVKLVQNGDIEIFGVLIERYEEKMLRYARKFLFGTDSATDLVQDVFTKAYINISGFDTAKRFSPWLYRIAHNCFINELKKNKREPVPMFDMDIFFPNYPQNDTPETEVIRNELKKTLGDCINNIDYKYKEVLILYYYEELSYKEISDILHIPVATIGMRISRGKEAMKKIILKEQEI